MFQDIQDEVIDLIMVSPVMATQSNEASSISQSSHLLWFARSVSGDNIKDEILVRHSLETTTVDRCVQMARYSQGSILCEAQ
ncbi:hypothetical protein E2C01_071158 [Portunus trituberculatus]|uniref:Uncharacterized protein n=1 Tax=Portunus trituberculatus TaxID=210409 RepID=A0A5B7HW79_PORTR|nr:hypothetical protein [Portunus trituberculatus]